MTSPCWRSRGACFATTDTRPVPASSRTAPGCRKPLFQRFGDKNRLFVAAMIPERLDAHSIVGAETVATVDDGVHCLTSIAQRLHRQIAAALPPLLQLTRHPMTDATLIDAAHTQLGVSAVIDALVADITALQHSGALVTDTPADAIAETLLLGLHGLVLMECMSAHTSKLDERIDQLVPILCSSSSAALAVTPSS